jgi:hypothetical protein
MGYLIDAGAQGLAAGTITWSTDTIKARLSRTTETVARTATVMTGIGLSATDTAVSGATGPTLNGTDHRNEYACSNIAFASVAAGAEIDKLVLFKFVTNDADSIPIAVVSITAQTPGSTVTITADMSNKAFYLDLEP